MLLLFKSKLAAKFAVAMTIPLVVNFFLYSEMQRQLVSLERINDELSVRRRIVESTNNIVIANYFALQSLMQFKMFKRSSDRQTYEDYLGNYRTELNNLAILLSNRPGDQQLGKRLVSIGQEYLAALSGSQFSPDEKNEIGSFFDSLERNRRLKNATVSFLLTLKNVANKARADVEQTALEESISRNNFKRFCQWTIFANSIISLLVALFFARRLVRRINVVRVNSERLARGLPLLAEVQSTDEVGALDTTFRKMAADLKQARSDERAMAGMIKESRDELALVINKIPAGLFITNTTGQVELLNTVAQQLLNIDIGYFEQASLDKIFRLKAVQRVGFFEQLLQDAREVAVSLFAQDRDGELIPVTVSVALFTAGDAQKYLITIVDETQNLMLQQAKSDFFNMVSHDLRTPLTSISGVLQMTMAGLYGPISAVASEKLNLACVSSDLLLTMINRLLEIEKIESSALVLKIDTIEFSALVKKAGDLISPQLDKKLLRLELDSEPCLIAADSYYLLEVILNLLTNAIKYSPAKGKLFMSCRKVNNQAIFELVDQGPGVPADKRDVIFERFLQADSGRDGSIGFGLGLSICKKIILEHGGTIGVKDGSAGGAVFWFSIPAKSQSSNL